MSYDRKTLHTIIRNGGWLNGEEVPASELAQELLDAKAALVRCAELFDCLYNDAKSTHAYRGYEIASRSAQ